MIHRGGGALLNFKNSKKINSIKNIWRCFLSTSPGETRRFTVAFSAPMLFLGGAALLCAIGWAFFMGLMVGKGQNPADRINELTGGFLASEASEVEEETSTASPIQAETTPEINVPKTEREKPQGAALAAWSNPRPVKKEAPKSKSKPESKVSSNSTIYDFTYQAAAVKSLKDAETLNKKIRALGYRGEVKKSGKVYLAIINMRGKDKDIIALREKLRSIKLGKPLLLSKKEVAKKQGKTK